MTFLLRLLLVCEYFEHTDLTEDSTLKKFAAHHKRKEELLIKSNKSLPARK